MVLLDTCQIDWGRAPRLRPDEWSSQNHCENREIRHPSVKAGSEAADENLDPSPHAQWAHIHLRPLEAVAVLALGGDLGDDKDGVVVDYSQVWGVRGRAGGGYHPWYLVHGKFGDHPWYLVHGKVGDHPLYLVNGPAW